MPPNVFNVIKNNTIDACQSGITHVINDWNYATSQQDEIFFCQVTRGNSISNSTVSAFGNFTSAGRQRKDLCVYDGNTLINNAAIITEDNGDAYNQIWIGHDFIVSGAGHTNINVVVHKDTMMNSAIYRLEGDEYSGKTLRAVVTDFVNNERIFYGLLGENKVIVREVDGVEYNKITIEYKDGTNWIPVGNKKSGRHVKYTHP